MMAQVVEMSVTNNSSFQNYPHPDNHTIRTTDSPGFKPFTKKNYTSYNNKITITYTQTNYNTIKGESF